MKSLGIEQDKRFAIIEGMVIAGLGLKEIGKYFSRHPSTICLLLSDGRRNQRLDKKNYIFKVYSYKYA